MTGRVPVSHAPRGAATRTFLLEVRARTTRGAGAFATLGGVALPATLHDFQVELSHVDAGVTERVAIRAARHPSESMERVWVRVIAQCWLWREGIEQGPGLCEPDLPDVIARDLTGEVTLWARVGRPDPARVQQEADRNPRALVAVVFDSPRRMEAFAEEARGAGLPRLGRVELAAVDPALLAELSANGERRIRISLTIVGDHLYVEVGGKSLDGPLHRSRVS